jgi:hypothetical protein
MMHAGSPGQWTIPSFIGTVTSIHSLLMSISEVIRCA